MMRKLMICGLLLLCSCSFHSGRSKTDVVSDRITSKFSREMLAYDLYVIGTGGGQKDGKIREIDVIFMVDKVLDIVEGRRLVVKAAQVLLDMINSNPKNETWFVEFPVTPKSLTISIIGKTPERYKDGDIAVASVFLGNVYFKEDDPEKKIYPYLREHKETFEEAVEILKNQEKEKRATVISQ